MSEADWVEQFGSKVAIDYQAESPPAGDVTLERRLGWLRRENLRAANR